MALVEKTGWLYINNKYLEFPNGIRRGATSVFDNKEDAENLVANKNLGTLNEITYYIDVEETDNHKGEKMNTEQKATRNLNAATLKNVVIQYQHCLVTKTEDLTPEKMLIGHVCEDSLSKVELFLSIENEMKVAIPDAEMEKLITYGDLEDFVCRSLEH